jgi:hypothetical protein
MAAASPVYTVATLAEALELSNKFSDVVGYMVAPLQVASGGQRKWHALDPEDSSRWMAEAETTEEKEPRLPHPDNGAEGLPPLPESKIGVWEVSFIDKEMDHLRPRVRIQKRQKQSAEVESEPGPSQAVGENVLLQLVKEHHRFSMDSLKATSELQRKLTEQLQEELSAAQKRAAEAEKVRDFAIGENSKLDHKLAELESSNLIATTIQKVFEGKPELLITAGKDLLSGLIEVLQKTG